MIPDNASSLKPDPRGANAVAGSGETAAGEGATGEGATGLLTVPSERSDGLASKGKVLDPGWAESLGTRSVFEGALSEVIGVLTEGAESLPATLN